MNIKPLADRILLKAVEKENITTSGIYIPEWANKERPYIYEVIAVWPGKEWKTMNVKVWDKVLSGQYSWDDVKIGGKEFKIVGIDYVLAIIE